MKARAAQILLMLAGFLAGVASIVLVVLLVSGLCLYLPSLAELVGRRPLLKTIHVYTALAWIAALLLVVALLVLVASVWVAFLVLLLIPRRRPRAP